MCYQPPPGASLSHSVAASLRLGPGGSLSTALARAQPPFPPSTGQAGRWEQAIRAGGSGAGSSMPPAPCQGGNMGWGGRSVPAQHLQGPPSSHHPGAPSVQRGLRRFPGRQRQGRGWPAPGSRQDSDHRRPLLGSLTGERPGFTCCREAKEWWLCFLAWKVCGAKCKPTPNPSGTTWGSSGEEGMEVCARRIHPSSKKVQTRRLEEGVCAFAEAL